MGDSEPPDFFQHQSTGYTLGLGEPGQETLYETCACVIHTNLQLYVHYYITIDLSLIHLKRASETQNHLPFSYWVPEHKGTGDFMMSECMKLVLVPNLHMCIMCIYINVCAGYICFVKL